MCVPAYMHYIWTPPGVFVGLFCLVCSSAVNTSSSILFSLICSLPSHLLDDPVPSLACPLIQTSSRLISRVVNIRSAVPGVGTAASCKLIITLLFSVSASNLFPCCRHGAQCLPAVPREHAWTSSSSSSSPQFSLCWKAVGRWGRVRGENCGYWGEMEGAYGGVEGWMEVLAEQELITVMLIWESGSHPAVGKWPWKRVLQQISQHSVCPVGPLLENERRI